MKGFDLGWQLGDLTLFFPIMMALIGFISYWFISHSDKVRQKFIMKYGEDQYSERFIPFTKWVGFFSMGIVPLLISSFVLPKYGLNEYGLTINKMWSTSLLWILGLACVIIPMNWFNSRKESNLKSYPQIRIAEWSKKTIIKNILGWVVYLLGYEILFRGILLFPVAESIGAWPAIAINCALYSGTHIPKGLDETIGAIPLGIVLSLLTLYTETIWIAFFVHITLALSNSFTALKFHPNMKIVK